jgi:hypothetical protein
MSRSQEFKGKLQLLELCIFVLVHSIAPQSALERTVGREGLERKDDALDRRLLESLGAADLSEKN